MRLFLLFYFTIYGGMHLYLVLKVRRAFESYFGVWPTFSLSAFCVLMVLAPMATRLVERNGHDSLARILAVLSYSWMACVFWFLAYGLLVDAWNLLIRLVAFSAPDAARWAASPRAAFIAIGVLVLASAVWGLVEAAHPRLTTVRLRLEGLPPGTSPIRIVQISDLHLGLILRGRRLGKIVSLIEEAKPDVLVCTGDLAEDSFDRLRPAAEKLAAIPTPLGKFASLGNHEYYASLPLSLDFHQTAGFRVLRNEVVAVGDHLRIAGVDGPSANPGGQTDVQTESNLLPSALAPGKATILLKHYPVVREESRGRFDLQLSGHAHGGQIFPFGLLVRLNYSYGPGLHDLGAGSHLYVSRGSGTWGPPMRLFAPAEATLFIVEPPNP